MRKSFLSFFSSGNQQSAKPTFGQKRAENLTQRLDKAIVERRKLALAEAASDDPLKTAYSHKSHQVERKIDRLTGEISDAKK